MVVCFISVIMATKSQLQHDAKVIMNPYGKYSAKIRAAWRMARMSFEDYAEAMGFQEADMAPGRMVYDRLLAYCDKKFNDWLSNTNHPILG